MLSSIPITEQVKTLFIFLPRTKAYAQLDPYHRQSENLISIFYKDRPVHQTGRVLIYILLMANVLN